MRRTYLLDCTLRDGGYVNDWKFGYNTICGFCKKIEKTGIEILEVGFLKGTFYDKDKAVFPKIEDFISVIQPKSDKMKYVAMLDMSAPVPLESIAPYDGKSVDGIRVIFKKDKLEEAYRYCEEIQRLGYFVSVNFVGTDTYTDQEFIEGIKKFNMLHPYAMAIVDTFGLIKKKQFMRLAYIADNNMEDGIMLGYHAHNNLQQAFANAEALVEMNLKRDLIIDACVFGMGRGAGNLNLELFAEHMNENYGTDYQIEPMLEIMDEYLSTFYKKKFWGYSLPLYLSATSGCHPNYAIYLAEKDTLTAKAFGELLASIPEDDKLKFSKEKAEKYYRNYVEKSIDDTDAVNELRDIFREKNIVVIAPGRSVKEYEDCVKNVSEKENTICIAVNFVPNNFKIDYVFSNNIKRYNKIQKVSDIKYITTSNMSDCKNSDYVVDFASYASSNSGIIDNSGIMLLRLLSTLGVAKVSLAGMDGYSEYYGKDYYDQTLEYSFAFTAEQRNEAILSEIEELRKYIEISFITPSRYDK